MRRCLPPVKSVHCPERYENRQACVLCFIDFRFDIGPSAAGAKAIGPRVMPLIRAPNSIQSAFNGRGAGGAESLPFPWLQV
jgi:hypothetical protein